MDQSTVFFYFLFFFLLPYFFLFCSVMQIFVSEKREIQESVLSMSQPLVRGAENTHNSDFLLFSTLISSPASHRFGFQWHLLQLQKEALPVRLEPSSECECPRPEKRLSPETPEREPLWPWLTRASIHRRAGLPGRCHLAQPQRRQKQDSKALQCYTAGQKPTLTPWKAAFLSAQRGPLWLCRLEPDARWREVAGKGVEPSSSAHHRAGWRAPKVNSAPFPRRGLGLSQHLKAIHLRREEQPVFQFSLSQRPGLFAFINAKWLTWKLFAGLSLEMTFPLLLEGAGFWSVWGRERADWKRRASATPAEGGLPLRASLKGQSRQGVSRTEKVCLDTRALDRSAKELYLGFWISCGSPRPVADKPPAVGIVNVARARELSWVESWDASAKNGSFEHPCCHSLKQELLPEGTALPMWTAENLLESFIPFVWNSSVHYIKKSFILIMYNLTSCHTESKSIEILIESWHLSPWHLPGFSILR